MTTKQCKKCKQEKQASEYSKGQGKCKQCRQELRKKTYDEVQKEKRKEHYKNIEKPKEKEQQEDDHKNLRAKFYKMFNVPAEGPPDGKLCTVDCNFGHVNFGTQEQFEKYFSYLKQQDEQYEYDELPKSLVRLYKERTFNKYSEYFRTVYQVKTGKQYGPEFFILY